MPVTRSIARVKKNVTKRYRARVAKSECRGKGAYACAALKPKCKLSKSSGKRKSFCRKAKNQSMSRASLSRK